MKSWIDLLSSSYPRVRRQSYVTALKTRFLFQCFRAFWSREEQAEL